MILKYDKGFDSDCAKNMDNIIGLHDKKVKQIILDQLQPNDTFINSTWIIPDQDLVNVVKQSQAESRKVFCYSGPDWDSSFTPPARADRRILQFREAHELIDQCDVSYIGNRLGKYYFSFWLDFVYTHKEKFLQFDPYDLKSPLKQYMCLNRKPHSHRVMLFQSLQNANLLEYGHVSIGGDFVVKLPLDITNEEGDHAVNSDVGGITNDITSLGHKDNWNSHFLNVVTETTDYTDVFITEKTFKPIFGRRPFIILGDKNTYSVLKEWGFDTFDDLFGTGYKRMYTEDRICWIMEVIESLKKENDLDKLLISLKPRLEKNYQNLLRVAEINRKKLHNILDK
jgi:hypothetical protein